MAELFSCPYLWTDGNVPPAGFSNGAITLDAGGQIQCAVPALAGDTASFTVEFDGTDPDASLSIVDASNTGETVFYSDTPQFYVYVVKATSRGGDDGSGTFFISLQSSGSATLTLAFPTYPSRKPMKLFGDPANWMDVEGNSPPSQYNAATGKYTFDGSDNGTLYCTQGSVLGDTVVLDASVAGSALSPTVQLTDHVSTILSWGIPQSVDATTSNSAVARQLQIVATESFREGIPFAPLTLAPPAPVVPTRRKLELCYSKDGGHTFSPWRQADLGNQGDFNARALFRRLGLGRRIVLRIRYSGDSTRDVVQASVDTSPFP